MVPAQAALDPRRRGEEPLGTSGGTIRLCRVPQRTVLNALRIGVLEAEIGVYYGFYLLAAKVPEQIRGEEEEEVSDLQRREAGIGLRGKKNGSFQEWEQRGGGRRTEGSSGLSGVTTATPKGPTLNKRATNLQPG